MIDLSGGNAKMISFQPDEKTYMEMDMADLANQIERGDQGNKAQSGVKLPANQRHQEVAGSLARCTKRRLRPR